MKQVSRLYPTVCLALLSLSCACSAADAQRQPFGSLDDGMKATVISLGASLQSLVVPDAAGKSADIVLGYASIDGYKAAPQYFGATVGRFANRIAKGRFTLDGHAYQIPLNDKTNTLHGGTKGFDKVVWSVGEVKHDAGKASVTLTYVSPDGDMGYPGKLNVSATYTLDDQNRLSIDYRATTDKPTIVNISNHTYWNLSGEGSGSVLDDTLTIPADSYLPTDATSIPTGQPASVAGTVFDFRTAKPIGRDVRDGHETQLVYGHGYDHNWILSKAAVAQPRMVARVADPHSGRVLTLESSQPGLQFYSGNFLDGTTVGASGRVYRQGDAFVLEPQIFPDTPNQPSFGSARLNPGQEYRNLIVYSFTATPVKTAR
jgi:aldose 1-epimerase